MLLLAIGANSLVNRDIPDNCVVAGNPCRVIMSLDEYYKKRKYEQVKEATELVREYREKMGKNPDESVLHEFFWLFSNDPDSLQDTYKKINKIAGNENFTKEVMRRHKKIYKDINEFLDSIK